MSWIEVDWDQGKQVVEVVVQSSCCCFNFGYCGKLWEDYIFLVGLVLFFCLYFEGLFCLVCLIFFYMIVLIIN